MVQKCFLKKHGFTLSELLISLAILGVIATFTIPKVLNSSTNSQSKSIGLEVAGTISQAYHRYKLENSVDATTSSIDLIPYLNYVAIVTNTTIDNSPLLPGSIGGCLPSVPCLRMHNGALLAVSNDAFGGQNNTNAITFLLDVDGTRNAAGQPSDHPGFSTVFYVYYDGAVRSRQYARSDTTTASYGPINPVANADPVWFNWD